jgi:hypothetical protein
MSFAVLGCTVEGITITDPACTVRLIFSGQIVYIYWVFFFSVYEKISNVQAKTYPKFFEDLEMMRAKVDEPASKKHKE